MKHFYYGDKQADIVLIQPVDDHDLSLIENEILCIRELTGRSDFLFVAVKTEDWNNELAPWEAPAVYGQMNFGDGAAKTLQYIEEEIILPARQGLRDEKKFYLGGYSLAGLFSLWAAYNTDLFAGIAAVSPSVWFPGFSDYVLNHPIAAGAVYLSLGKKEEKTRNPVMAGVGDAIRGIYEHLDETGMKTVLEWNEGNHFQEPDKRTARGFAWLMKNQAAGGN